MRKNILGLCLIILCLSISLGFAEDKKLSLQAINSSIELFSEEDIISPDELTVFDVLRAIIFWLSPGIFFVGILLVLYGNFRKIETLMSKEMGIRKKVLPKLESYNYTFHEWLLERNTLIGLICIACAVMFFFILK
ncbi:MAG: hypothetical protein KJ710_01715 [Candidatus Omnitrophica bacterium]|nr:hypothetical protein [Candidatus Omnitrophota bacterium]MBU1922968.1 hypothetical protein [Candidatus Omnitrophota bacterium]